MSTATLSIGEQILLDTYRASNAASRAGVTPEAAREFDQRWGDVATEPRGVDYVETEAPGVRAMWLAPAGCVEGKVLLCLHGGGFVSGISVAAVKSLLQRARATCLPCLTTVIGQPSEWSMRPTRANGQPAAIVYRYDTLLGVAVLGLHHGGIARIPCSATRR